MTDTSKTSDPTLEYITKTWRELLTEPVTAGRSVYVVIMPEAYDGFISNELLSWLRGANAHIRMMLMTLPADPLRELAENWEFQLTTQGRVNGPTRVTLSEADSRVPGAELTAFIELPPGVFIAKLPLPEDSIIIERHEAIVRANWRNETT